MGKDNNKEIKVEMPEFDYLVLKGFESEKEKSYYNGLAKKIIQCLDVLLGDGKMALTSEFFVEGRKFIEQKLFPAVEHLGLDIDYIKKDYNLELLQSNNQGHPSSERLEYIKGHLQELSKRIKQYKV